MVNKPGWTADETVPAPDDDLCLAYADTRYWRGTAAPTEELHGPEELLEWAATKERLPRLMIDRFSAWWRERPDKAAAGFEDAIALREAMFRCFAATAAGRSPPDEALAALNVALAAAPPRQHLRLGGWDIGKPDPSASALLAPTLWSAADLLAGTQLQRVRQCSNPECGWL